MGDASSSAAGGLGRLDLAARLRPVGEPVGLPGEPERAGGIVVRPRLHVNAFHLRLERRADKKRDEKRRGAGNADVKRRAAAHGMPLRGEREILPARAQIVRKAAEPVVAGKVIEEYLFDLRLSVFAESVFALFAVVEMGEIALVQTQKEDRAVPVRTGAERAAVIERIRRLIRPAGVDEGIIVHGKNVHADAVALRDILCFLFQRIALGGGENAGVIHDIGLRSTGKRRRGERKREKADKKKSSKTFFHFSSPPYRSARMLTAVPMSASGAAMAANVAQYFPASVGRSPTILPVCPFMAKRKLLPFQRVESIHTGNSA